MGRKHQLQSVRLNGVNVDVLHSYFPLVVVVTEPETRFIHRVYPRRDILVCCGEGNKSIYAEVVPACRVSQERGYRISSGNTPPNNHRPGKEKH